MLSSIIKMYCGFSNLAFRAGVKCLGHLPFPSEIYFVNIVQSKNHLVLNLVLVWYKPAKKAKVFCLFLPFENELWKKLALLGGYKLKFQKTNFITYFFCISGNKIKAARAFSIFVRQIETSTE